ncbi:LysR family transcriptional regulator [Ferrimonas sediminicola]|uniref:LysR family transcriptional regulator n=1 Tax=Ferrimonas sediminicola TaxID=2569538 RepID=A0A4U1BCH4_9GAMM|nr:LysR family transcriptional regulator [Ferrimonas sediminicola]TKB48687.1 LysR family transcriptional regulator [Ferrimonas sediminicola]
MNRLNEVSIFSFQVFVLVYESLNSMTVAQALNVPGSKISRTLNQLRHALDDPLFHRKQYGFEPSEMAVKLYPEMKRMLDLASQACSLDVDERSRLQQEVVVTAPSAICVGLLQHLKGVAEQHHHYFTFIVRPTTYHMEREIRQGEVDLAISNENIAAEGVECEFITCANGVYLVGQQAHPIWRDDSGPRLDEIIRHPFIVNGMPAFNDRIDPLEVYAREAGRELRVESKISGMTELVDQLLSGHALSFVGQRHAVDLLRRIDGIQSRRLPDDQFALLHQRMGAPGYYLLSSSRRHCYPDWLIEAIRQFVIGAVVVEP